MRLTTQQKKEMINEAYIRISITKINIRLADADEASKMKVFTALDHVRDTIDDQIVLYFELRENWNDFIPEMYNRKSEKAILAGKPSWIDFLAALSEHLSHNLDLISSDYLTQDLLVDDLAERQIIHYAIMKQIYKIRSN